VPREDIVRYTPRRGAAPPSVTEAAVVFAPSNQAARMCPGAWVPEVVIRRRLTL
jgi:hypothetical protein